MRRDVGSDPRSLCSSRPLMQRCRGPVLQDQSPGHRFSVQLDKKEKAVYLVGQKTRLDYGPQGLGLGTPACALCFWCDQMIDEGKGGDESRRRFIVALSTDRTEEDKKKRKKSLVSLVSITRLKGQMGSQWGSLSGSHYWNRKGFFLFTYTQVIPGSSSL